MKTKDFIEEVMKNGSFSSQNEAKNAIESVIKTIKETVLQNDSITITGFGTFKSNTIKGRIGVIPNSTKTYISQDKKGPKFTPSKKFKSEF